MEVRELTFKGESDPKLYACGKCGKAYSPKIYGGREEVVHAAARRTLRWLGWTLVLLTIMLALDVFVIGW